MGAKPLNTFAFVLQTRDHSFVRSANNEAVSCRVCTFSLKWISTNFPKRLLLLLRTVLAFPKASSKGFAAGFKRKTGEIQGSQRTDWW